MPTKFAAIDIGSNSSLLLILEAGDDRVARVVIDTKVSTKLSSGTQFGDAISAAALQRQYAALDKFAVILNQHQISNVIACGTQVFRVAANGRQIAEEISRRYGWKMTIISGEREAQLSYQAAATGLEGIAGERTVMDVGGGSSEVIVGDGERIAFAHSFPVGAVSLTERFELESGDHDRARIDAATSMLKELFQGKQLPQQLANFAGPQRSVIAVGGTAATLAALKLEQKIFVPKLIHGVELSKAWIQEQIVKLFNMDREERRGLLPFDPDRADIIVGGALIIECLLERHGSESLIVSNCGLRWGLISDAFPQLKGVRIEQ